MAAVVGPNPIAIGPNTGNQGRLAGRLLRVGGTVLAVGVLIFFAARSENGGLAGILLSGLLTSFVVSTVLAVVKGTWRASRRIEARHTFLGGCVAALAACATGGVFLCFGNELLLGAIFGGGLAYLNDRRGWISWQQLLGLDLVLPPSQNAPAPPPPSWSPLDEPAGKTAAAVLTLVLVVVGLCFGTLGAGRALEGVSGFADFGCTAPCALMHGLWMQVLPDSQGKVVSQPDAATMELRLGFRDDAAGERDAGVKDFTLSDGKATYDSLTQRPECGSWLLRMHIDQTSAVKTMCFVVPAGATFDPAQLVLKWSAYRTDIMIPLGPPTLMIQIG